AEKAGLDRRVLNEQQPRRHEIAFTSERRRMTTLHDNDSVGMVAYSKGAADVILPDCATWIRDGHERPLSESDRAAMLDLGRTMASAGLRVLAVARKRASGPDDAERVMTWLRLPRRKVQH